MQSPSKPVVEIWTDGSTWPSNPGNGGWAAILVAHERIRTLCGFEFRATNNNMEARGVLEGLRALTRPCEVHIYTDSMYVINGLKKLKWKKTLKTNVEIWEEMLPIFQKHQVSWEHVAGHNGVAFNEWANILAGESARDRKNEDKYEPCLPEAYKGGKKKRKTK